MKSVYRKSVRFGSIVAVIFFLHGTNPLCSAGEYGAASCAIRAVSIHQVASSDTEKSKIYSWKDGKGVRRFSDRPPREAHPGVSVSDAHVYRDPEASESLAKTLESGITPSKQTRVLIRGNQILVPVRLGYGDREIRTMLVLDTGATRTTIFRACASELNLRKTDSATAKLADGRVVPTEIGILDYLAVGPHRLSNHDVSIIDFSGSEEVAGGLLGMNFLKNVRYDIDFERQTIDWR